MLLSAVLLVTLSSGFLRKRRHIRPSPRFLACPPQFLEVLPWTNIYSGSSPPLNRAAALRQHCDLVLSLRRLGVGIGIIPPEQELQDMTFVTDAAVVKGGRAVMTRLVHPERRNEVFPVSRALRKRGAEIIQPQIGTHYSLEGGDVVFAPGRRIFLGHGFRSTENASRVLSMAFPYHRVIPIRLLDPYFYHLDTCFCPLPDGKHAVIYEHAFDETSSALLCNEFEKIQTTREEALLFT